MNLYKKYPEVFDNKRVQEKLLEFKLTPEQIEDALPILLDMAHEKDDANTKWLTSFKVNSQGEVVKTQEKSTAYKKEAYIENIITRNIEDFIIDPTEELIKEKGRESLMRKLSEMRDKTKGSKRGIYLYGKYGVGKTYLMKRLAQNLASQGKKIAFISTPVLSQELKKSFSSTQTGTFSLHRITDLIKEADYLFLDDIGAESISAWFRDDCLFPVLNYRMQRELPTFFTSNFSLTKLEAKESTNTNNRFRESDKAKRLISRIKALAEEVEISGTNKRY